MQALSMMKIASEVAREACFMQRRITGRVEAGVEELRDRLDRFTEGLRAGTARQRVL